MTNIAAMPIYGEDLKQSSLEPKGQWPWKLVCSIGYSSTSKFVQLMTLSLPWPILRQGQIWSLMLLYGKKGKIMDFSATIVVCDIKVGRFSLLNEYMNHYEYQRSRSFTELRPRSLRFNILIFFCSETARPIEAKFHIEPPWDVGNDNLFKCSRSHDHSHINYGEKLQKSFSSEPRGRWLRNLVYSIGYSSTTNISYDDLGLTLTIFMTWSNLFPNASAWVKAYIALSANVFPSLF